MRRIAVMQPYFFPYLGYFQLVNAVDHFVFYDDVNYIKRGWIHRNRILSNSEPVYFGLELKDASQNKLINEVLVNDERKVVDKLLKTLKYCYSKADAFKEVYPLIEHVLIADHESIASAAATSVKEVSRYLGLETVFHTSSLLSFGHDSDNAQQRLIDITRGFGADVYINASGGRELYDKAAFHQAGIELYFIEGALHPYNQGTSEFHPGLSIIDVLMHNKKDKVCQMLMQFQLN